MENYPRMSYSDDAKTGDRRQKHLIFGENPVFYGREFGSLFNVKQKTDEGCYNEI